MSSTTIALDTFMLRFLPLPEIARIASEIGYEAVEISWREDFVPLLRRPRAHSLGIAESRTAFKERGVEIATLVALYRWASPDEQERRSAIRYWRRAIEVAVELECRHMNSEFSGDFEASGSLASEAAFWASIEEVLPILEREDIVLSLEPHPGDFVESNDVAVDMIRSVGSDHLRYLYCTAHTFHLGDDIGDMVRYAAPVLDHVHLADTLDHRMSSGLRYIVNPLGAPVRVHQHLNIGEGEVDFDALFAALAEIDFEGILTSCVFAWEEAAIESARKMYDTIVGYRARFLSA
jgi:myo-inositol catabolism protein IolH